MTRHAWTFAIAAALLGAGLHLSLAKRAVKSDYDGQPVSEVVFPDQQLPILFSHALHLNEAGASCDDCHDKAAGSKSSLDNLIPTEEACSDCHAIDRTDPDKKVTRGTPPARCDACHVRFDAATKLVERVNVPPPNLKFSHKAHTARNVACTTCHGDLAAENVELATREQLPKMGLCLTCHDGTQAPNDCTTCHLADPGGFVRTEYRTGKLEPSGALRGDAHDLTFRTSHQHVAQNDEEYCGSCHRKSFCTDCHNGVIKPMDFHGNDYVTLHVMDARRNSPDCSSCHRLQTFCVGCHSRSGVSPDGKGSDFGLRVFGEFTAAFHPDGWVEYSGTTPVAGRGANHHSFQAQRNIKQCAACHREDFCTNCHSAESPFAFNPHPPGWRTSHRCRAMKKRAGRMCLRCHVTAAELQCR